MTAPRVILIGSVLKCSDRSIRAPTSPRALYAPGLLKHFHDLRCIAQAVISFQRIIQKVTPLIICTRYIPAISASRPVYPLAPPPTPDFTRCCVRIRSSKKIYSVRSSNAVVVRNSCFAQTSEPENILNPHVDFSLCHR